MEPLLHICEFLDIKYAKFGSKFTNESIYEIIQNVAPSFNKTLTACKWQFKIYNALELFAPVLTGEGVCFSFNALNSRDIFTDE